MGAFVRQHVGACRSSKIEIIVSGVVLYLLEKTNLELHGVYSEDE
jgi:hypothetical protein